MTPRDWRAIAIGSAVVLPALLVMWGVRPYVNRLKGLQREVATQRDLVAREQALIHDRPAPDSTLKALQVHLSDMNERLFPGGDELGATAALATYVTQLARQHGVLVQQGETRPPGVAAGGGGLKTIEVGVRAAGDLEGVLEWLAALETGPRLVEVARLGIERAGGASSQRDPERETLAVGLVVRGYTAAGAQ
jgi:type II secretory pathway component PulM